MLQCSTPQMGVSTAVLGFWGVENCLKNRQYALLLIDEVHKTAFSSTDSGGLSSVFFWYAFSAQFTKSCLKSLL
jgi:hypothetical protein